MRHRKSAIFPVWFTLFDQRPQAFLGILQAIKLVEENVHGVFETIAQRESHAAEDGSLRHGQHGPGVSVDARDEVIDGVWQIGFRHQPIDDAEFQSTFGGNGFTEKHEFQSDFWTHEER